MKNGKMSQWTLIAPISMEDGRPAASLPPSLPPVSEELCSTSQFGTLEGPSHSPLPAAQLAARPSLPLSLPLIYQPSPHAPPAFPFLPPHFLCTLCCNQGEKWAWGRVKERVRVRLRGFVLSSPNLAGASSSTFCIVWRTGGAATDGGTFCPAAAADTDRIWAIPYGAIRIFHAA